MDDLRTLRGRQLLTQQELADKAQVSKATIVGLEGRKVRSHPGTLRKVAAALGVEPAALAYLLDKAPASSRASES